MTKIKITREALERDAVDLSDVTTGKRLPPIHPGEQLAEFLNDHAITEYRLATDISVPSRRINEIIKGLRGTSADTALRLAQYFGTSVGLWMNLQSLYDVERARAALRARKRGEGRTRLPD